MNIYIYGNKKFVSEINSLLMRSAIENSIEHIKGLSTLQDIIKEQNDDIFIIDDEKIIHNKLLNKLNPFKGKDSIDKEFLDKYGIEDICFNSLEGLASYIKEKIALSQKDELLDQKSDTEELLENDDANEDQVDTLQENIQDDEVDSEASQSLDKQEDIQTEQNPTTPPTEILTIDDIADEQMEEAVSVLDNIDTKDK